MSIPMYYNFKRAQVAQVHMTKSDIESSLDVVEDTPGAVEELELVPVETLAECRARLCKEGQARIDEVFRSSFYKNEAIKEEKRLERKNWLQGAGLQRRANNMLSLKQRAAAKRAEKAASLITAGKKDI